jgi:hypothetical protein
MGCSQSHAIYSAKEGKEGKEELVAKPSTSFDFVKGFLSKEACCKVVSNTELGLDPSSMHFAERRKAIRFLTVIDGRIQTYTQDYFVQNEGYNEFSGGYKRQYELIPQDVIAGSLASAIFAFTRRFNIPEKTVLLAQIQTTVFRPVERYESVTGQGIHTDGADRACILCLHRGSNIEGSLNQYHLKLDGSMPLCEPTLLETGDISFFKDNEIFHYVTPGGCSNTGMPEDCTRTVLIIHSPAEQYLSGRPNLGNSLSTRPSSVKLRELGENDEPTNRKETVL